MRSVLCLVADPATLRLDRTLVDAAADLAGASPDWLAQGEAVQLAFHADRAGEVAAAVTALIGEAPVDHAILTEAGRRKRLLLSDMDSTMITVECIDELADAVGLRAEVAAVTRRAMNGEIDFEEALVARVALLEGLPLAELDAVRRERVLAQPGAATLLATSRAHGVRTVLVSGGFTAFTGPVREALGFDRDVANTLEVAGGCLTGRLVPPILGARAKLATLREEAAALGLDPADALALGDGANDLPMLHAAGLGIAFKAHPKVRAAMPVRIDRTSLKAALFFMGYRAAEIVDA